MEKTCSCTGHRPKGFPFAYGEKEYLSYLRRLEREIERAIVEYGVSHFISGMALGADTDFAELVLRFRKRYKITLECAIPCPEQTWKWTEKEKERYSEILKNADTVTLVSERYTNDCMLKRNRYMVDKSDLVIAVFNGAERGGTWYTIRYAKQKHVPIVLINLTKIKKEEENK